MAEPQVFVMADRALSGVVAHVQADQWDMVMPPDFATSAHSTPTLRDVVNYHAYDDAWVPDMLAGRTMDDGTGPEAGSDLLGDEPQPAFAAIVERACAAAEACTDLDATVHCSFGDYPAREYFWQISSFRGLRAHDIAVAIGVDCTLPEALVEGLWEEIAPHAEEWRHIGVFPAAIPVPEDAPLIDRLLGLTGRPPHPH